MNAVTPYSTWSRGLEGEIAFWRLFRSYHPELFRQGLDTQALLDDDVEEALLGTDQDPAVVVDIGSGMLSGMGFVSRSGRRADVVWVDALAREFGRIARHQGFTLPITHIECHAERLSDCFQAEMCSAVYCRNALDHCYDPPAAIRQAVRLLLPGGSLILKHYDHCADINNHQGLHQWNLSLAAEDVLLEGHGTTQRLSELAHPCQPTVIQAYRDDERPMIKAIYRKPTVTP